MLFGNVPKVMRNRCMTPSMRNKILCETTLYDAGNIPYEGKSCIRVLLYESILCMTLLAGVLRTPFRFHVKHCMTPLCMTHHDEGMYDIINRTG